MTRATSSIAGAISFLSRRLSEMRGIGWDGGGGQVGGLDGAVVGRRGVGSLQ